MQVGALDQEVPTAQAITQVPSICWDVYGAAAQEAGRPLL